MPRAKHETSESAAHGGQPGLIALAGLLLPVVLFVAMFTAFLVWDAGQRAERDAKERAQKIIERVDGELQRELRALSAVAQSLTNVAITRPHPTQDRVELNAALFPEWVGSVVWAHGETTSRFSSLPASGLPPIPPAWSTPGLLEGGAVIAGIEQVGEDRVVLMHQAVPGDTRRLILTIALRPDQLRTILMAHMPEASIGAVVDRDGNFIARSRDHDLRVGTQSTIYVRNAIAGGADEGIYRGRTLEGFDNVSAFVRSPLTGWSVHIAIAQDLVEAPLRLALIVSLVGGAATILLAGGLIWLLLRDIRRRQTAQLALVHAQRVEALGRLTGGIAHDFNNLLTIIIGNIERSRKDATGAEERNRLLEAALGAARRAGGLTRSLLAYSRQQHLTLEVVEADACVAEAVEVIGRALGEQYEIITDLQAEGAAIKIDRAQFVSALVNLAINARDAMETGGRITVQSRRRNFPEKNRQTGLGAGDYVAIAVSDTGPGMPPGVAERAFDPFFTTKETGKGTGLGLAQVDGFARQSGGAVQLATSAGKGVTITLLFPEAQPIDSVRPVNEPDQETAPVARQLRVLLVEDDPGVREHACHLLAEGGHTVVACETAAAAEAQLRAQTFDLLFSDIVLPGTMSGAGLANLAEQIHPGIGILLATGYAGEDFEAVDRERRVLAKPYTASDLAQALSHVGPYTSLSSQILLVEDEPYISMSAADALAGAGYQVVQAATLANAREALRSNSAPFALAIVDLGLPDGNGQSLVEELKSRQIPVLIASGASVEDSTAAVIAKPYTPEDLLASVQRLVRR